MWIELPNRILIAQLKNVLESFVEYGMDSRSNHFHFYQSLINWFPMPHKLSLVYISITNCTIIHTRDSITQKTKALEQPQQNRLIYGPSRCG